MDDEFLNELRATPPEAFSEQLRGRLQAQGAPAPAARTGWRFTPALTSAAAVAVVALLFMFPGVRGAAGAFLSLFRVQNFVAVPVNRERIEALAGSEFDLPRMLGNDVTILAEPGPPFIVPSIETAAAAARMPVAVPTWLPDNTALTEIKVQGERAARVIVNTELIDAVLTTLAISDVDVPRELNGQSVTIRIAPLVGQSFAYQTDDPTPRVAPARAELLQVRNPDVTLPPGLNLATVGEIGLRVLGLDAREAARLAGAIDWNTTLVVPIPPLVSEFRQVTVRGAQAVAIEAPRSEEGTARMLIWSSGGRVFVLQGTFNWDNLLRMAESIE